MIDFWRKAPPRLDASGAVVEGGMWAHQRAAWDLPNFVRMLVTGYGGGKTLWLAKSMISLSLQNSPAPGLLVSPTFPMAKLTTIPTMSECLAGKQRWFEQDPRFGRGFFSWDYNKSDHVFRIKCGKRNGEVWLRTSDDPRKLKGANIGFGGLDEPFIQPEAAYVEVMSRIREHCPRPGLLLAGTPEQLNWGYDLVDGELNERLTAIGRPPGIIQASTSDNLALPPAYIDNLMATLDEDQRAAYFDGQFLNLNKGLVYHHVSNDTFQALEMPSGATLWLGMDFNANPMGFCVGWKKGDRLHVVREWETPNSDTQAACAKAKAAFPALRQCYPGQDANHRSAGAPGGLTSVHFIKEAGLFPRWRNYSPKSWTRNDSENSVNHALRTGKLTVDPSCKRLKKYLRAFSHENRNKTDGKAMSHLLDALRYAVSYMRPVALPRSGQAKLAKGFG